MKRESMETSEGLPEAGERFVDRWSRLKGESTTAASDVKTEQLETVAAESAKAPTDEDMPDIETLTPESDYTGFLSPQVSESLRRLALRKLFQGAQFNIRDGLDDYDQDFTKFAKLGDIITADMKHLLKQEERRAAAKKAAEEADQVETRVGKESGETTEQGAERPAEPTPGETENDGSATPRSVLIITGKSLSGNTGHFRA